MKKVTCPLSYSAALSAMRRALATGTEITTLATERLLAALGYDIAQNLYISKKNLLVEGSSDLIFLEVVSGLLE